MVKQELLPTNQRMQVQLNLEDEEENINYIMIGPMCPVGLTHCNLQKSGLREIHKSTAAYSDW
jgi:hypothetical protein